MGVGDSLCGNIALTGFHAVVPASAPSAGEDKWMAIVEQASLLLIQALSGLCKAQQQCWTVLELHSIKIVSSGIIWVSLQEVGTPQLSLSPNYLVGLRHMRTFLNALSSFSYLVDILYICVCVCGGGGVFFFFNP